MSGLGPGPARELRDGYEVHRAALAHGFDVSVLARQVLEVTSAADGGAARASAAFVHGVPQSSTLSGVTFAQDLRMRRTLLTRAGLRVPPGATFAVGDGTAPVRRFAQKVGYPVVLKPAVGDNTTEVLTDIGGREDLREAIHYLHTPPEDRADYTRAAYSLTELREPGRQGEQMLVPPGYRFLVEKQVRGEYLRLLVLDGAVINALHLPGGPWGGSEGGGAARGGPSVGGPAHGTGRDISGEVHPSIRQLAVAAVRAVHGVALAAVDVVVEDHTRDAGDDGAVVVEFSERPWLAAQHRIDPQLSAELGEEILRSGLGGTSPGATSLSATSPGGTSLGGADLGERQALITVGFDVDGGVEPAALAAAVTAEAQRRGLVGQAEVQHAASGTVSGTLQGPPAEIAWLFEALLDRGLDGQRAMSVTARQGR